MPKIEFQLEAHPIFVIFVIFIFIFLVGKGGNASCTMAPEHRVRDSSRARHWARSPLDGLPVSYPLKAPFAGVPGCTPINEGDMRAHNRVELGQAIRQSSECTLPSYFIAFLHETRHVPAFRY